METLPELLRFVWLSRGDLPAAMDPATPAGREAFLLWWVFHGRHEFPQVAPLIPADVFALLLLPAPDGVPALAAALRRQRADLQADFAADDPRLAGWLFIHGLDEFGLRSLVGPAVRDWFSAPLRAAGLAASLRADLAGLDEGALLEWWLFHGRHEYSAAAEWLDADAYAALLLPGPDGVPPLAGILRRRRADLQADFAADDPRLAGWLFIHGLDEFGLRSLVGPAVRDWFSAPLRAAGLAASLRADLAGQDEGALLEWWLFHGRHEYPAAAEWLDADAYAALLLPGPNGVPPLAGILRRRRADLQADFAADDPRLAGWLFIHGLEEFGLRSLVGPAVRHRLSEAVGPSELPRAADMAVSLRADLAGLDEGALLEWWLFHGLREHDLMPLLNDHARATLGERLLNVVARLRPDVAPDLPEGVPSEWWPAPPDHHAPLCRTLLADARRGLVAWYLNFGLGEYGLETLPGAGDRAFLAHVPKGEGGLSPAMVLAWYGRADLRAEYDIAGPAGRAGLAHWYREQGAAELPLAALPVEECSVFAAPAVVPRRRPYGVNLVGFAHGELGIGEDVRCMARAMEAAGIPFSIVNLETRSNCRAADSSLNDRIGDRPLYDTNIFCLTGFDTVWAYVKLGPDFFAGARNIGNWPWELPAWPAPWSFALNLVDEVWGISRFCTECFSAATSKPVLWMPSAIRPPAPSALGRAELGLPEDRFVFTVVFDFNSFFARKNPSAALEAFERAFGTGGSPLLAVKVMNADSNAPHWRAFRRRAEANPSVVLLEGTWPYDRVLALAAASDCLVSLHRAEGLGRGLAEAMALGVPVIATGWSGSTDLTAEGRALEVGCRLVPVPDGAYPCAEGQLWAEPDIDHAARRMREAAEGSDAVRAMVDRARVHVLTHHSVHAAGARYRRRLEALWG